VRNRGNHGQLALENQNRYGYTVHADGPQIAPIGQPQQSGHMAKNPAQRNQLVRLRRYDVFFPSLRLKGRRCMLYLIYPVFSSFTPVLCVRAVQCNVLTMQYIPVHGFVTPLFQRWFYLWNGFVAVGPPGVAKPLIRHVPVSTAKRVTRFRLVEFAKAKRGFAKPRNRILTHVTPVVRTKPITIHLCPSTS
jgi:hypothetical protein